MKNSDDNAGTLQNIIKQMKKKTARYLSITE